MVPRPLEQAPADPAHDRHGPLASSGRRPGGFGRKVLGAGAEQTAADGGILLSEVSLRIEDGLLMCFRSDGDPMPPAVFIAAAHEQPDTPVRLGDGTAVPPMRAAAVLEAQARGPLTGAVEGAAADRWIRSMLGLEPQPEPASAAETEDEGWAAPRDRAAEDTMVLSLDLPDTLAAGADGAVDLAVLDQALARCRAVLLSATVTGMPAGALLSAGLRHDDGSWSLAADDLPGLSLRTAAATPGDFALEITLRALQGEDTRKITVRRREEPAVEAAPPAAAADEAISEAPEASATAVRLAVRPPVGEGIDPRRVALVIIGGVPEGAVLSAGVDNGDGSWMLSPQDLVGLELRVPAGRAGEVTLEVTALAVTSREGEIARATERLRLSLAPAAPAIPLRIDPAAARGLQALMIRDLPPGARLSAGTYDSSINAWVVLPRQLDGLTVTPPHAQARFTLTVMGIALGGDGRAEARLVTQLPITPA